MGFIACREPLGFVLRLCILLFVGLLLNGCSALAPVGSLVGSPNSSVPPVQVHEQTAVRLARDNFVLVKTNVWGRSKGFSLFGIITVYPATLTKAMTRMYASAQMQLGQSQTVAHLVVEQSSSFYLLFGIPKVEARADIVQFVSRAGNGPLPDAAKPPGSSPPK